MTTFSYVSTVLTQVNITKPCLIGGLSTGCDGPHYKSGNGIRSFNLNLIKYRLHKLWEISEHRDSSAAVELLHALLPTFGVILITYYPFHLLARLLPQVGDIRLLFVT